MGTKWAAIRHACFTRLGAFFELRCGKSLKISVLLSYARDTLS